MSIYVTGDCHGDFHRFSNKIFHGTKNDVIIVTGDFGLVWDGGKTDVYWINWFSQKPYEILFVDGNHENFDKLHQYPIVEHYGGRMHQITDNVFHLIRGEIYQIQGSTFFAFGGAQSHDVDKDHIVDIQDKKTIRYYRRTFQFFRIEHQSWWQKEMPTPEEMAYGMQNLAKHGYDIDYIVTHDRPCPDGDLLQGFFQNVLSKTTFRTWYHGHYHETIQNDRICCIYQNIEKIQ